MCFLIVALAVMQTGTLTTQKYYFATCRFSYTRIKIWKIVFVAHIAPLGGVTSQLLQIQH